MTRGFLTVFACLSIALLHSACAEDENASDKLGIGAQCTSNDACNAEEKQICLTNFKGGYCSTPAGCQTTADCPTGSACVAHDDGTGTVTNYCFRSCTDKVECNANRDAANESNCSSSVIFASGDKENIKMCIPPSG